MKSQSEVNERKRQAVEMRIMGKSQQQIADILGVDQSAVSGYLKDMGMMNPITDEEKQEYRKLQLERIDKLIAVAMSRAVEEGNLNAMDRVTKLEERRAKLIGLDEPAKQEVDVESKSVTKILMGFDKDGHLL